VGTLRAPWPSVIAVGTELQCSSDFSDNNLCGPIPNGFFQQCWSLRAVSFANNNLSSKVPESLSSCTSLETLNFSSNQLHGELPSGIWYLKGLQSLDFSSNLLEGEIREGIQNLYDLKELRLGKNRFSGRLPADIGDCLLLKLIDFNLFRILYIINLAIILLIYLKTDVDIYLQSMPGEKKLGGYVLWQVPYDDDKWSLSSAA
ncbi:hypothetical protein PIB30_109708, partial [Stylosanthes scabra]|nr:hypothetical protein [Stylosanthes scabra]